MSDQEFLFANDSDAEINQGTELDLSVSEVRGPHFNAPVLSAMKVLVVDDDEDVHAVTTMVLNSIDFEGHPLALLRAYSAEGAKTVLSEHTDIAVILLDVVMEAPDAGLKLVEYIRNTLKRDAIRIILRTGQAGAAPQLDTITSYDINDYRNKSELTRASLVTSLYSALRNYQQLQTLEQLAYHDSLTQLLNRNGLMRLLDYSDAHKEILHLAILNIDNFTLVNDTWGAVHGDLLLQAFGRRLSELKIQAGVANLGGDTFAVVVASNPVILHNTLREAIATRPFTIGDVEHSVTFATGVARFHPQMSSSELLSHAYIALRQAKRNSDQSFISFKDTMLSELYSRTTLLNALEKDFESGVLFLVYQPQIDLQQGSVIGLEALMRWRDKDNNLVSPPIFIQLAEQSGLIHKLGLWVLDVAIREFIGLERNHNRDLGKIAVNVSALQLQSTSFADEVADVIQRHALPPHKLDIEVTESLELERSPVARANFRALKQLGCRLSIDDFGTGYSSLSYLEELDADFLKIDRTFVNKLSLSDNAHNITKAIVSLARTLDVEVIFEGVETQQQAQVVKQLGCRYVQGFLYAKPMDMAELSRWLD